MSSYCFPILTSEDCVAFFKEISSTPISEEDFKKPEPRRWHGFFGTIFELMTGRQADTITQILKEITEAEPDYEPENVITMEEMVEVCGSGTTADVNSQKVHTASVQCTQDPVQPPTCNTCSQWDDSDLPVAEEQPITPSKQASIGMVEVVEEIHEDDEDYVPSPSTETEASTDTALDRQQWEMTVMQTYLQTIIKLDILIMSTASQLHTLSDCIEYSELQEESLALMTFTVALQRILCAAGVTDFSIRDLIDPKPKRLVRIVSGAINFIRFRSVRAEMFDRKKEELERRREFYDRVLKEKVEVKKALAAKKEAHGVQMMKMKQLQEENDAISMRLQDLHRQREVKQRGLAEAKKELSERNACNDQLRVNILAAQAEGEKLSQRIVQSPERVKVEQEQAKNRILALKSQVAESQARLAELQRREKGMADKQQHAEKAVRLLRDITTESEKLAQVEKENGRLRDSRHDLHAKQQGLTSKLENQKKVLASRQDRLSKLDLQYQNKKANLQEQIAQLSHLKEKLQASSSELDKMRVIQEKEQIQEEVQRLTQKLEKNIEIANGLYFEIIQQVDKMNVGVANGISEFRQLMKK